METIQHLKKNNKYNILNKINENYITRENKTGTGSIIDHIITDNKDQFKNTTIIKSDISDHYAIATKWEPKKTQIKYEKQLISKTNNKKINKSIQKLKCKQINNFETLTNKFKNIIEKNTSETTKNNNWINEHIIKEIKERNKLYQICIKYPNN